MRILFVSNYYPPHEVGGYEQLCRDVALRLVDRGHRIAVLTSNRGVARGKETDEPNIYRTLYIQPDYGSRIGPVAEFFLTRRRTEAHNRRALQHVIDQFRPDIVFIWNLEGLPYELATDAEASPKVAVAYWLAHYSPAEPDVFWRYWSQPPGKRRAMAGIKSVLRKVALTQLHREGKPVRPKLRHVAVVSEYMRRKGLAENTLPVGTVIIPNGIEPEQFYRPVPSPDTPTPINLLLAGRLSADKGIHVAIEAAGKLSQTRPQHDFRLIIAGSGPVDYLERLQRLAAQYGIDELLSFRGWLPRQQVPGLMHVCHILLLPAIYPEAFSRVVMEGMAAGLAVIGTLTGGTGELLQDGLNGLTFAVEDSVDLARQIGRLLDDPHLRYRLAARGQKTVLEHYTLEHMVDEVEDLLHRAVIERHGKHG